MKLERNLLLMAASAVLLSFPTKAETQGEVSLLEMLAIAKIAGACGIMDSMVQFQKATQMPGGDEFVTRFWAVEEARLGQTIEQKVEQCNHAVPIYDQFWKATNRQPTQ